MKKVILHTIEKQINNDLYRVAYYADGKLYVKWNVNISLYGYSFNETEGVDDFNISLNVVKNGPCARCNGTGLVHLPDESVPYHCPYCLAGQKQ